MDPNTGYDFTLCPFSDKLAIDWPGKRVLYQRGAKVGDMIHELGHVFASKLEPKKAREMDFFGWEFALAKEVGVVKEWVLASKGYCINSDGEEFGMLSRDDQSDLIEEFVTRGRSSGLLDRDCRPKSVR